MTAKPTRRQVLQLAAAALAAHALFRLAPVPAWAEPAQAWPSKPIRLIVPLTPGSATDVMGRLVMDQVSVQLGQPIIVENRPGAGNTIGMSAVAKAEPDGYTILANSSTHTVTLRPARTGVEERLAAIAPFGNMPVVMIFNPSKATRSSAISSRWRRRSPARSTTSAGAGNLASQRRVFRLAAGFSRPPSGARRKHHRALPAAPTSISRAGERAVAPFARWAWRPRRRAPPLCRMCDHGRGRPSHLGVQLTRVAPAKTPAIRAVTRKSPGPAAARRARSSSNRRRPDAATRRSSMHWCARRSRPTRWQPRASR